MVHLQKNLGCLFFFFCLALANDPQPLYKAKGEDVVLDPNYPASLITSIEWKHGSNIAAQWFGVNDTCYKPFEDRCTLNHTTGALKITGLEGGENGIFSAEINNKQINSLIQLFVIAKVPKPTVSSRCDDDSTSCNLTCDGDTTGAEPFNCTWLTGDVKKGSGKELKITKETGGETFTCMLQNPVSSQSSDSFPNPIITGERNRLASIVAPIVVLAVLAIIVLTVYFLRKKKNERSSNATNPPGAERGTEQELEEMLPNGGPQPDPAQVLTEVRVEPNHVSGPAGTQNEENISAAPLTVSPESAATGEEKGNSSKTGETHTQDPTELKSLNTGKEAENSEVTSNNHEPTSGEGGADGGGDGD